LSKARRGAALVWDSNCGINLANYLTNRKEKIAIVAKGCDAAISSPTSSKTRSSATRWYIIGVPCKGMIDKRKVTAMVEGEILEVSPNRRTPSSVRSKADAKRLRQGRGAAAELQPSASTATR
jgi:hypothetical protein